MAVGQIISRAIAQGAVTADDIGALEITHAKLHTDMDLSSKTVTMPAVIRGPATLTIDPAAVGDNTGLVVIAGDFQVDGTTTTINSTTMTVDDKNLVLASGAGNASAADGAGITIDGASATMLYTHATTSFDFNKPVNIAGNLGVTGTVDGVDIATRDAVLTATTTTANAALPKAGGAMTGTVTVNTGGGDATNTSHLGGDFSTWIRIGDPNTSQTQTNGFGIKLHDAGVIHWSVGGLGTDFKISRTNTNGDQLFPAGSLDALTINSSGKVGIGETSPANILHIKTSASGGPQIELDSTSGTANSAFINFDGTSLQLSTQRDMVDGSKRDTAKSWGGINIVGAAAGSYIQLQTSSGNNNAVSTKMTVDKDGNVGIGTNNPSEKFVVHGDGARMIVSSNDYEVAMLGRRGSSGSALDEGYLRLRNAGVNKVVLDTNGTSSIIGGDLQLGDIAETTGGGNISLTKTSSSSIISIMSRSATDGHTGMLNFYKTPATSGNYTSTTSGDVLGEIRFYGVNNSAVADIGAMIQVSQTGAFNNSVPAKMTFTTQETQRMSIHADGHIGIGDNVTVSSAWSNVFGARVQLDTKGVLAATDGSMQIGHNWYYDGAGTTGYKYIASGKANRQVHVDDYISWEMEETAGTAGGEITFTERMRFTPAGNLGLNVGSNNPLDKIVAVVGNGGGILLSTYWSGTVTSGQKMGAIAFKGYADGNTNAAADAKIEGVADGNHSGTSAPARLEFYVKHPAVGPGSGPTRRMQLSSYGELLLEDDAKGWASFYMNETAGIRYHVKRFYAGASTVTANMLRVKRHYWGVGFYKLTAKQQYYITISEQEFYLTGHGRDDGSYNPSYSLSYQNVYNGSSSRMQITSPSGSAPGSASANYVDVQIVVPAYHHYIVVIEAGGMAGYSQDVSSMSGNDMYALH